MLRLQEPAVALPPAHNRADDTRNPEEVAVLVDLIFARRPFFADAPRADYGTVPGSLDPLNTGISM